MDAIYGEMMCLSKKPFVWCSYGRYDDSSVVNKIKFISSSSSYTMYNLKEAAIETFGTMLNGEKANSSKNAKVKLKKMSVDDGRTAPVAAGNNLGRPMNVIQVPHHEPEPAAPHWYEAQLNEDALRYDDPDPGVGNLEHPEEDNGVPDGFRRFVARINQRDNAQRGAENIRQVFDHLGMANINTEDLRRELSEEDINQISELVRRYGVEEAAATIARGIGENGNVTVDANGNLAIDIG